MAVVIIRPEFLPQAVMVDSLFDDERESEDATQKEVDDLFKEDD